jgi:hypothetical protein
MTSWSVFTHGEWNRSLHESSRPFAAFEAKKRSYVKNVNVNSALSSQPKEPRANFTQAYT